MAEWIGRESKSKKKRHKETQLKAIRGYSITKLGSYKYIFSPQIDAKKLPQDTYSGQSESAACTRKCQSQFALSVVLTGVFGIRNSRFCLNACAGPGGVLFVAPVFSSTLESGLALRCYIRRREDDVN